MIYQPKDAPSGRTRRTPWIFLAVGAVAVVVVAALLPIVGPTSTENSEMIDPQVAADMGNAPAPDMAPAPELVEPAGMPTREFPGITKPKQAPQFVVISFDGACETRTGTLRDMMDTGKQADAAFTFFLSGLCLVPTDKNHVYHPPRYPQGRSDIGFGDADLVGPRIKSLTRMYREGHEVGTHYLGHFCTSGSSPGVGGWTKHDWLTEIRQVNQFLDNWRELSPHVKAKDLPFTSDDIIGGRTPCLQGNRSALHPAIKKAGHTYEASDPGYVSWPKQSANGLWLFPLPALQLSGTNISVLAMDYNFMVNQNASPSTSDPAKCRQVEQQTYDTYKLALAKSKAGNRAPIFIGSHLNDWVCNAYIDSLHRFVRDVSREQPDVHFVSNAELVRWLEAQPPKVIRKLQRS